MFYIEIHFLKPYSYNMGYLVQIFTHTDGDFSYQNADGFIPLMLDDDTEDKHLVGDFETFDDAISASKEQFQSMITSISALNIYLRDLLIKRWRKILAILDNSKESPEYPSRKQHWNTGNQYGGILIVRHECDDVLNTLESYIKQSKIMNDVLTPLGYSCTITSECDDNY